MNDEVAVGQFRIRVFWKSSMRIRKHANKKL